MTTIGVDPGLSGAIAIISPRGEAHAYDMPVVAYSKTGSVKNVLDVNALASMFRTWESQYLGARVFLERVNAFPGQGVSSMFSLGMSYWGVAGVVAAYQMPLELVRPQEWKKHYGLDDNKDLARGLAARYYPGVDLSRKKDHGRAEALLIARYGQEVSR